MKISALLLLTGWMMTGWLAAGPEVLQEGLLKVTVDTATGEFGIDWDGKPLVQGARSGNGGAYVRSEWLMLNEPLGATRALQLHYDNHRSTLLALFPGRPFLCLRQQISNPDAADATFSSDSVFTATILGPEAPEGLKAFGSGGLVDAGKNPGSHMYLALVQPKSGTGLVAGWFSADRASGVLFSMQEKNQPLRLAAVSEFGAMRLPPKAHERGEWFCIGGFSDARTGLEAYADLVALHHGIQLPAQPVGHASAQSAPHGKAGDQSHTAELATFGAANLKSHGFSFVRIDDGWQSGSERNGPAKNFSTHAPDGPYPAGMQAAAAAISSHGLTPGLWFMPFAADHLDPSFANHGDWFVKSPDGSVFETKWGGGSLDLSRPDVQEHLRTLVRRMTHEWGMRHLHMDGLYTGLGVARLTPQAFYQPDGFGSTVFSDPSRTPVEIYRSALKLIRAEAAAETYLLGGSITQNLRCLGASFGLVDAMRISPDNDAVWKARPPGGSLLGPLHGSRLWFFHNRVWHNDPAPVFTRPSLTLDQARALASWVAVSGQLATHSEWLPGLPPERLDILRKTMPAHRMAARPVDIFERDLPRVWTLKAPGTPARVIVGLTNWDRDPAEIRVPLDRLELRPEATHDGWEFWSNQRLPGISGELNLKLPPTSCMVLLLRERSAFPLVISSTRHVLQGVLELGSESWDAQTKSLSGRLQVVGGETGELRILLPDEGKNWGDGELILGESDAAAGVRASLSRDGPICRLRLDSPDNREISWAIRW